VDVLGQEHLMVEWEAMGQVTKTTLMPSPSAPVLLVVLTPLMEKNVFTKEVEEPVDWRHIHMEAVEEESSG
jgi:hypothetical protein